MRNEQVYEATPESARPDRSELIAEVEHLVEAYGAMVNHKPPPDELPAARYAICRALTSLEESRTSATVAQAVAALTCARLTLSRIRPQW
jgi:hypothetical protein